MPPSIRIQRLQNLIKARISAVLHRDVQDPRILLITITDVELAKDLSTCKVKYSTLVEGPQRRTVERGLEDVTPYVQRAVAQVMKTRLTPQITFKFDPAIERMERIDSVLQGALAEDRKAAEARGDDPDAPLVEAEPHDRKARPRSPKLTEANELEDPLDLDPDAGPAAEGAPKPPTPPAPPAP